MIRTVDEDDVHGAFLPCRLGAGALPNPSAGAASEYHPIWLACSPAWRTEGGTARETHPAPVTETAELASVGSLRAFLCVIGSPRRVVLARDQLPDDRVQSVPERAGVSSSRVPGSALAAVPRKSEPFDGEGQFLASAPIASLAISVGLLLYLDATPMRRRSAPTWQRTPQPSGRPEVASVTPGRTSDRGSGSDGSKVDIHQVVGTSSADAAGTPLGQTAAGAEATDCRDGGDAPNAGNLPHARRRTR